MPTRDNNREKAGNDALEIALQDKLISHQQAEQLGLCKIKNSDLALKFLENNAPTDEIKRQIASIKAGFCAS